MGSPLHCPLSCPLFSHLEVVGCPLFPYMEVVGSLICMAKFPWAAHGQPTPLPTCSPRAAKWAASLFFPYGVPFKIISLEHTHTEKTEELPTSLPMGCTWATEWVVRGLPIGILPCKFGCPLLPYMATVGSSVGSSVGSPLLQKYEKNGQFSGQRSGLPMGILPCKLGCPLLPYKETMGSSMGSPLLPYEKVGSSVGRGVGCSWVAHGNFAMQIRLSTTYIYGDSGQLSGQLSGQPTTFKYGNSGQFSGQPTDLRTIKFKMKAIFDSRARQHMCIYCML